MTQIDYNAIKLLALDVDGVLTDGSLWFSAEGDTLKSFNSLDGHGIKMLKSTGVDIAIITGRTSAIVQKRAVELGINTLLQGREDKLIALKEIADNAGIALSNTAYMGDDLPDLSAIRGAGFGITVPDSNPIMKSNADYVTQAGGGKGAVREVCELIMHKQNTLEAVISAYLGNDLADD